MPIRLIVPAVAKGQKEKTGEARCSNADLGQKTERIDRTTATLASSATPVTPRGQGGTLSVAVWLWTTHWAG